MDSSLGRKSQLPETQLHTNPKQINTPNSSPPKPLTFRNTPSPDRAYTAHKHPNSSLQKPFPEHPMSTEQYTPLGISRSHLLSARTPQDIEHLIGEHRYQVETLLFEIGRLNEELRQSHEMRELEVRKARQEFQEASYLQVTQIRQNQQGQAEVFELQIRKLKEQLSQKNVEADRLSTCLKRERDANEKQKNRYSEEVRLLIEKKNAEIYELRQESENKLKDFEFERANQLEQIKYTCDREIAALNKKIDKQEGQFTKLKTYSETQNKQKQKIITYLQTERNSIERRYEQRLADQNKKYENIRDKFNHLINQFSDDSEASKEQLRNLFESEYQHMMRLVKTMESDNSDLRKQLQTSIISANVERQAFKQENDALREKVKELTDNTQTDMELLKVKLAVLHETDIKNLKELYDLKLKHSSNNVVRLDDQVSKLREFTNVLSTQKYELKKKYENTISILNSKIMKMRMGFTSMESEYKQKLQNQKSVMLMTSRSFLKEAEVKDNNNKFLEQEVRKLRQLMDLQGRQNQNAERAIEQKVLVANNQLERLSSKVLVIAKQKKDIENQLNQKIAEKDQEILSLRNQLTPLDCKETDGVPIPEIKIIQQLREELSKKKDEIGMLKDKIQALQSLMKEMEAETERLQMENNMNSQELKRQFQTVSEQHLSDFKKYYEEKLQRLEEEKAELKKIASSKSEQITQLIKKYKQTEEDLKEATCMMKKRTELEEKVMNIGLDVNLVRNMADLVPNNKYI